MSQTFAEGDVALNRWNQRVQMPPTNPERVADVCAFASKDLIRGELISIELDRTGCPDVGQDRVQSVEYAADEAAELMASLGAIGAG